MDESISFTKARLKIYLILERLDSTTILQMSQEEVRMYLQFSSYRYQTILKTFEFNVTSKKD